MGSLAVIIRSVAFFTFVVLTPELLSAQEVTCKCEPVQCKPCEISVEQPTFYTAKCGPKNSKIKSCARVTCEPVTDQKQCLAELAAGKDPIELQAKTEAAARPRAVAFVAEPVGTVSHVSGVAKLIRVGGGEEQAKFNQPVFEGDVVETSTDGKVRVAFKDQNVLNVAPDSRVTIETQQSDAKVGRRKTLLSLMYGKIRTKVNKNNTYDGASNTFQVRTKSAVAGVRGTDFVTSFTPGDKRWITEVKTLEGLVEFGGDSRTDRVEVRGGEAASFIITGPPAGDLSNAQLRSFIEKGILSGVRKMHDEEMQNLDQLMDFSGIENKEANLILLPRAPAAATFEPVCNEPKADLKWCSFACEGNPAGQSKCNTSLPGVRCVRRICNANGRWAEPTSLPKSAWSACNANGIAVRESCGDY